MELASFKKDDEIGSHAKFPAKRFDANGRWITLSVIMKDLILQGSSDAVVTHAFFRRSA